MQFEQNWIFIWSLNLNFFFKSTSINMLQLEHRAHQYHAMLHYASWICIAMLCLYCCCSGVCLFSIDSSPDIVSNYPEVWNLVIDSRASKPPLIMSIKTISLLFSYAWIGDSHVTVLSLVEHILCMTYHCCHNIKQTST